MFKAVGLDFRIGNNVIKLPQEVEIGNYVSIDDYFYCSTKLALKDYIHIGPHCSVIGGKNSCLYMDNFSFIAAGSRIICGSDKHQGHGIGIPWIPKEFRDETKIEPVYIKSFAGICTNCVIMPGVIIEEGCIIGVGSVIYESTEPWTTYMGNPAVPVKRRPKNKILDYAIKLGYNYETSS